MYMHAESSTTESKMLHNSMGQGVQLMAHKPYAAMGTFSACPKVVTKIYFIKIDTVSQEMMSFSFMHQKKKKKKRNHSFNSS